MKTIKVSNYADIPKNYTGIVERRHRENDGPYPVGTKFWYLNGERHREDGPAVEYPNGFKEYWLNDEGLDDNKIDQLVKKFNYPIETAIKLAYYLEMNQS